MKPARQITVDQREHAIFTLLNRAEASAQGSTAKEIWKAVCSEIEDAVTLQAYYKVLDRMVSTGRLEKVEGDVARFKVAPYLHSGNAVTLDDLYALIDEMKPSEAIAQVVEARRYYEERRHSTLAKAAVELAEEDPRDLVERFVLQLADQFARDVEIWEDSDLRDRGVDQRVLIQAKELDRVAYRYLGLTRDALDVVIPHGINNRPSVGVKPAVLRAEIRRRVFGDRVLERIDPEDWCGDGDWNRRTVSGSDGSTYPSVLQLQSATAFVDDVGSHVVTFNNAASFVPKPPMWAGEYGTPYHSVPMTRSAIDDPTNRGMVLAPFMFRYLDPSEYEHLVKCATDVVQWRVDRDVFFGDARSIGDGKTLARPLVHIRDGTVTPQEREWNHYQRLNEYGDMTREGIRITRQIAERIVSRGDAAGVFAGATKTTQTQFFSSLINWYISHGSADRLGAPIDPDWDTTRAAFISDNEAMSYLMSTLSENGSDKSWVSFVVVRPFHSVTDLYNLVARSEPGHWAAYFARRQQRDLQALEDGTRTELTYLMGVADLDDDDFVWCMEHVDYATFYIGHTGGDPPPVVPRYEFVASLRDPDPEVLDRTVRRAVGLVTKAVEKTGLAADTDHNYLSSKTLVRIVPFVVYDAHEKCKALGRSLEMEFRSIVVANLQRLRGIVARDSDVLFRPLALRRFVERFREAQPGDGGAER